MRLYIDSGTHSFTDTENRIDTIEKRLNSVDVVFIEKSTEDTTLWDALRLLPIAPLLISTMILYVKIGLPLVRSRWGDDRDIENQIVDKHEADCLPADKSKLDPIRNHSPIHFVSNWLIILTILLIVFLYKISILAILSLVLGSGVALMLTYLSGVHESRNSHIAREIARYKGDYDEACLVTGQEHHNPIGTLLNQYKDVEVLNPTSDNE